MPLQQDFDLARYEDGVLTVTLTPPTALSNETLVFNAAINFLCTSGLITKSCASGFLGGQSGITIVDPTHGVMNIQINSSDTSGLDCGPLAYTVERQTSGKNKVLVEGYLRLGPSSRP